MMTHSPDRPLVLLDQVPRQPEFLSRLEKHVCLEIAGHVDSDHFLKYKKEPKVLVVRSPTRIQADALESLDGLEAVVVIGAGTDCVDEDAARRMGIEVRGNPGVGAQSVAEFVIGMMVFLARRFDEATRFIPENRAWSERAQLSHRELHGGTLGVIGLGEIGSRVGRMARSSFGMQVVAYDSRIRTPSASGHVRVLSSIDELMRVSDTVTVHVPLTLQTHNMIGAEELEACRDGAMLINTSRGGIVDEDALVGVLRRGKVASACVDVFEDEPPSRSSPLLSAPNVVLTPHIGGLTQEADKRLHIAAADAVLETLGLG